MKTYVVVEGQEGPQSLVCKDVEQPQPGPGQVLVRMRAHALNYRDLVILAGG
jgi:NADPH:quinone reductase-like Zn-dependent oxidoreductase